MTEFSDEDRAAYGAVRKRNGVCHWRVWAPHASSVELLLEGDAGQRVIHALRPVGEGDYVLVLEGIPEGQRYAYSVNGGPPRPDFASAWQPQGVHGFSAVWTPELFEWSDRDWRGIPRVSLAIYELHVGTFTPEGTFAAIIPRLKELRALGITAIELMPVAQFPGARNWGYDGVFWSAVQNSYGGPTELQRLVDACHREGLAVLVDVVYNHLGPEGNYLAEFGPCFTDRHQSPWGAGLNYDDVGSAAFRAHVLQNVSRWLREFHCDGLRLDAVHAISDASPRHLLSEISQQVEAAGQVRGWPAHGIAESCLNDPQLLRPVSEGGQGMHAQWSDDFHHCVHSLLTGERNGYYSDYSEPAEQLAKAFNATFVYDGCFSTFLGRSHGAPVGDLSGDRFVVSIQTHDQVGNRARGERLAQLVTPAQLRLAAALLLTSPYLPLLFMGEEYGELQPFPFFCDFGDPVLQEAVRRGRRTEFAGFAWADEIPDPQEEATFRAAVLRWQWPEGSWQAGLRQLYCDLLGVRRLWPPLTDRRNWRVERIHPAILQLWRGDCLALGTGVRAWFNISNEAIPLPAEVTLSGQRRLRTEAARYTGATHDAEPALLAPFEALIDGIPESYP